MKGLKRISLFISLLVTSAPALSDTESLEVPESSIVVPTTEILTQPNFMVVRGKYKITRLQVDRFNPDDESGRKIYIHLDRQLDSAVATTCSVKNVLYLDGSTQRGKHTFSLAMMAMSAQSNIELAVTGCDPHYSTYPNLVALSVER